MDASVQQLIEEIDYLRAENTRLQKHLLKSSEEYLAEYDTLRNIQRFKDIADNFPVIMWTAGADGYIEYFNKRFYDYTGLSAKQAAGWGWREVLHPDDLERVDNAWNISMERGIHYEVEYRIKHAPDGEWRWQLAKGMPLKSEKGEVLKWFGANTDIHEQKNAEKRKDEFLSIASHELKTPLTSLKAFLQLGVRMASPDDRSFIYIEKALKQSDRLELLIGNLLDVAKINAGKLVYARQPFNFNQLLKETVENFQLTVPDYDVMLQIDTDVIYNGDRLRIEQVITNFLTNAVKYSPGQDKIVVTSQIHHDNIVVSVQDFGIGIAPENLHNLFDRYYRVDNRSAQFQGLGLGLFIASEIIKRHNGTFWIESVPGSGSTFYFLLPLKGKQKLRDIETDNKTYYKGNFIEIKYNADAHQIESNWLGYQNYDSVKKGCLIILDLIAKNHCNKMLNDNTNVMGSWSEAVDWLTEYWFPAIEKAGLKYFAWIYSPSTFSRMAAQKSIDITMGKITAQFFTDRKEALAWLNDVE